uniref:Uncharacterized protein n=1 Tax=viral metagenome TaxID=1070528 RepID=A0A6C0ECY8_9ZZZZ
MDSDSEQPPTAEQAEQKEQDIVEELIERTKPSTTISSTTDLRPSITDLKPLNVVKYSTKDVSTRNPVLPFLNGGRRKGTKKSSKKKSKKSSRKHSRKQSRKQSRKASKKTTKRSSKKRSKRSNKKT